MTRAKSSVVFVAAVSAILASAMPASAYVAPAKNLGLEKANPGVTEVRWRGRHWHHRHYHRGYGGVGVGLAAGAILGSALAARAYGSRVDDATGYCLQRFKSYDPASGTYLGYDGYRHPCP